MSSLADIVGSDSQDLQPWELNKVNPRHRFTALHDKYWGPDKKSMKDEEAEWRKSQSTADSMDVDDGGCYFLDIGINVVSPQKIWIREDYKRIYDELEKWENLNPGDLPPSAVISGQPGIGKSMWIYYALRRRLGERKPVIWYYGEKCYLFVDEGVFEKPDKFLPVLFERLVWTLVDSGGIPSYLVDQGTKCYVIFTSSPNRMRWKDLHKSTRFTICIMNPWSPQERDQLVSITNLDADHTTAIYNMFGPIPRLWKDLSDPKEYARYDSAVTAAIEQMTLSKLEQLTNDSRSLHMDVVSHKLYLIHRMDKCDPRSLPIMSPITDTIKSMLATHTRYMERSDMIRLYKSFSKIGDSRALAGMIFEAFGQQLLEQEITLDIIPMVHAPEVPTGTPHLYSSHNFLRNPKLDASRLEAVKHLIHLDIKPSRVVESGSTQPTVEENVYYLPSKKNQVVVDSFIVSGGHLYIFKFSIAESHDIKIVGMKDFLGKCQGIPAQDKWHLVFIIPTDVTLNCLQLPAKFKDILIYSAVIAVELDPHGCKARD